MPCSRRPSPTAVTARFAEAYALGPARRLLRLYETVLYTTSLIRPAHSCVFWNHRCRWFLPSKKALARIYCKGLGVTPDSKAKALLKGLSKQEMKEVMDEIAER